MRSSRSFRGIGVISAQRNIKHFDKYFVPVSPPCDEPVREATTGGRRWRPALRHDSPAAFQRHTNQLGSNAAHSASGGSGCRGVAGVESRQPLLQNLDWEAQTHGTFGGRSNEKPRIDQCSEDVPCATFLVVREL